MFRVRLRACPCPHSPVGSSLHVTWAAARTASCLLALHIALMVCLPLDSAERASVQPAAEFRHVQRHEHVRNVYRALRTVPSLVGSSLHAACAAAARKTSLPARMSPSQHAFLLTRQNARAFNQPLSFDTSSVTDMSDMFRVRSGRAPTSTWIPARSWSLLAPHYSPLLAHSHHSPPHPRHRRTRRLSTSRSVLTRLASQP